VRIAVDEDALTEPERALARLLCDTALLDALRWIRDEDERRSHLAGVAEALNRVLPKARARLI
jgi:hypothetical protein